MPRGQVWLITSEGRRYHLPADRVVNHPNNAIPWDFINLNGVDTSQRLNVVHPEHGEFYIEFAYHGRTGFCLKCGRCCPTECEHLKEGKCMVRDRILDGWKGCLIWPYYGTEAIPEECGFKFPKRDK